MIFIWVFDSKPKGFGFQPLCLAMSRLLNTSNNAFEYLLIHEISKRLRRIQVSVKLLNSKSNPKPNCVCNSF